MRLKLFKKYFLITVAIIVLSLAVLMMILSLVFNRYIANAQYKRQDECCKQISQSFSEFDYLNDSEDFLEIAVPLVKISGSDIFLADSDGTVVLCACDEWKENKKCMHSSYIIPRDNFSKVEENKTFSRVTTLNMYKYPQYVSIREMGNKNSYYIITACSASETGNFLGQISHIYYLWAILPLTVMLIAIYFITYRMTKPLKIMSEAAKAMAKGDFSKRVPVTSDDEIGELAASFNMMTNSLSRLESMRRSFVGNVSHELRTPITTIGGFIDGMLDGTIKPENRDYYLNIVSEEVKRLTRLVNGMLSVTKLESGEDTLNISELDLYSLLCTIIISQEQRIEKKNIDIKGLEEPKSIKLTADKDLLYQAIYNLVDNAIKFTNQSGTISFKLSDNGNSVKFSVTNTGDGISRDELPYVFERFYKGDKSRSNVKNSTGLGLYLVKTIVTAHKGKISVMSKENKFTTFEVVLPKEI